MYAQFIAMKPPTFSKAEDPLEAKAWIKTIEAKFSAFVLPCSKENKANFAALQLRGEAEGPIRRTREGGVNGSR
jgi:hypothetical protein